MDYIYIENVYKEVGKMKTKQDKMAKTSKYNVHIQSMSVAYSVLGVNKKFKSLD